MVEQSEFARIIWANWPALLWTANFAWWASEIWIFARDWRGARGQSADRFSRVALLAILGLSLAGAQWCIGQFPAARLPDGKIGAVRFACGIVLMWLGIGLRQWAVATLGRFFRTTVFLQEDHRLVTNGPYRRLRNPSYSGILLTVVGQGLTMGNALALLVLTGGVLAGLAWRVHVETQALRRHFGADFEAYAARSWAVIPLLW